MPRAGLNVGARRPLPECGRLIEGTPCPRKRRKTAAACQLCLDVEEAAKRAAEPPRKFARQWRREGWLLVIWSGQVVLGPLTTNGVKLRSCRTTPINEGRWSSHIDPQREPWRQLNEAEAKILGPLLSAIVRDCYCHSFPTTGCDFCNGVRIPDGI